MGVKLRPVKQIYRYLNDLLFIKIKRRISNSEENLHVNRFCEKKVEPPLFVFQYKKFNFFCI